MAETYYAWDPVFDCILDETDASGAVIAEYTQEPCASDQPHCLSS